MEFTAYPYFGSISQPSDGKYVANYYALKEGISTIGATISGNAISNSASLSIASYITLDFEQISQQVYNNVGSISFSFTLSRALSQSITLPYQITGNITAADLNNFPLSGTFTLPPGQMTQNIPWSPNITANPEKFFVLTVSTPIPYFVTLGMRQSVVHIRNSAGPQIDVSQVSAGVDPSCAVLSTGMLRCWGVNSWGQLGLTGTEGEIEVYRRPTFVYGLIP